MGKDFAHVLQVDGQLHISLIPMRCNVTAGVDEPTLDMTCSSDRSVEQNEPVTIIDGKG